MDIFNQRWRVFDAAVDPCAHLDVLEGGAGLEDKGKSGRAGEEAQRLYLSVGGDDGDVNLYSWHPGWAPTSEFVLPSEL